MNDKKKIKIQCDDDTLVHIAFGGFGYVTLCGLDRDDPDANQKTIDTSPKEKIDCQQCYSIWKECRKWKSTDFAKACIQLNSTEQP